MKAIDQCFPVMLFIMLYKVGLTFETVDEILKCYHSKEIYWAVLSYGSMLYEVVLNFESAQFFPNLWEFISTDVPSQE